MVSRSRTRMIGVCISICIVIGAGVAVFFLFPGAQPFGRSTEHTITFGSVDTQALSEHLYLNEQSIDTESVSAPQKENAASYRLLASTSVRFWLKPEEASDSLHRMNAKLTISHPVGALTLITGSHIEGVQHELPLYVAGMENMSKTEVTSSINTHSPVFVYTKAGISTPQHNDSLESWLARENQTPSLVTSDAKNAIRWSQLIDAPAVDTTSTTLQADLHSNSTFAMYSSAHFELSLKKVNKNVSKVDDGVHVIIRDSSGVQVDDAMITNDGIENGKKEETLQEFDWNPTLPSDGVYTLEFVKNDSGSHAFLTDITVNTPYIALTEGIVQTQSAIRTVVKNTRVPISMSFVEDTGEEAIQFSGTTPFSYTTEGKSLLVDHIYPPETGTYEFHYAPQLELRDGYFLLGNAKTFDPSVLLSTSIDPDIIVTGINLTHGNNNQLTLENTWAPEVVSDMVVDPTEKRIGFELSQTNATQPRLFVVALNNYNAVWSGCGVSLFTQDEYPENVFDSVGCNSVADTGTILHTIIAPHSSVSSFSKNIDTSTFYNSLSDVADVNTTTHTIPMHLRGNHTFAAYAPAGLNLSVRSADLNANSGSDTIGVKVFDETGANLGSTLVPDDGTISNNGIPSPVHQTSIHTEHSASGIYIIQVHGQVDDQQDFLIDSMTLNTNKLMALDYVSTYAPVTLYTHFASLTPINLYEASKATKKEEDDLHVDVGTDQEQTIVFNGQNDHVTTTLLFDEGNHTFTINEAKMNIQGMNSAFTPDGLFTFGPYTLGIGSLLIDEDTWGTTRLYSLSMAYSQ